MPIIRLDAITSGGLRRALTPTLCSSIVESFEASPLDNVAVVFAHVGGAISRVKLGATAFWHREPNHEVILIGSWDEHAGAERTIQSVRGVWKPIEPLTTGYYINHGGYDESERRIRENYGDNFHRLATLKRRYDPLNLFRLNANIKPA